MNKAGTSEIFLRVYSPKFLYLCEIQQDFPLVRTTCDSPQLVYHESLSKTLTHTDKDGMNKCL